MNYENLIVEKIGRVGIIRINRPKALNALNISVLEELNVAFAEMDADTDILCIVLTGEGKAFVAGADIAQMKGLSCDEARAFAEVGQNTFRRIERLGKPVLAAINGFALGGGLELAMACDFRLASDKAKLGQPEVTLGVIPGFGGTTRLRRSVGEGNARMLLFTGEMISAEEAYRIGLVQKIIPAEELLGKAIEMAQIIASRGPASLHLMKKLLSANAELGLEAAATFESMAFGACFATGQAKEGMDAFLEKRQPKWGGGCGCGCGS